MLLHIIYPSRNTMDCPCFCMDFICLESTSTFLFRQRRTCKHIFNKKWHFYKSCKQHFDYLTNHHTLYNHTNQCSCLHLTMHITFIILILCKYYLHTIVQSVTWRGLFLLNLIFMTQVCCPSTQWSQSTQWSLMVFTVTFWKSINFSKFKTWIKRK